MRQGKDRTALSSYHVMSRSNEAHTIEQMNDVSSHPYLTIIRSRSSSELANDETGSDHAVEINSSAYVNVDDLSRGSTNLNATNTPIYMNSLSIH